MIGHRKSEFSNKTNKIYMTIEREKKPIALHHKGINEKDKLIHFLNLKTKCNEQMAAVEHLKKRTLGMKKSMNQLYSEEEHKTV